MREAAAEVAEALVAAHGLSGDRLPTVVGKLRANGAELAEAQVGLGDLHERQQGHMGLTIAKRVEKGLEAPSEPREPR